MKKTTCWIYIITFTAIIATGLITNASNLKEAIKKGTDGEKYAAWAILTEYEYNDNIALKYNIVNVNGFFRKILGQKQMNQIVKLKNGKLVTPVEATEVDVQAQGILDLQKFLDEEEIPLLYIQTPYEIAEEDSLLPTGVEDYSNANANAFLGILRDNGVDCMDLREKMQEDGLDHYESYYKTDHHWKVETAFWAYTKITEELERRMNFQVDPMYLSEASYQNNVYEQCFLGSNGRRTGYYFSGFDDLTIMTPTFDTDMIFEVPDKKIYREGTFEESLLDMSCLEGDNWFEMSQYDVYTGGNYTMTKQVNMIAPVDKKVLLIRDSYSRPVQAFMGTVFANVDTLDVRYYGGDVATYITESKPDIVIVIYNPFMLLDKGNFAFIKQDDNKDE